VAPQPESPSGWAAASVEARLGGGVGVQPHGAPHDRTTSSRDAEQGPRALLTSWLLEPYLPGVSRWPSSSGIVIGSLVLVVHLRVIRKTPHS
jgi:hypothetical protein